MPNACIKTSGSPGLQIELPALTGVRGLAAWWVVIYHFRENLPLGDWPIAGALINRGYLAVDLFFVLSGFIIGMNYMAGFQTFSIRRYLRFLALRLGRIYPLHLFMMVIFLINPIAILLLSQAHDPGSRYDFRYYVMSLLLMQNWGFSERTAWNVPAWSISTEWFAYLIFPGIVWMGRLASTTWRAVLGIVVSLLLLTYIMSIVGDDISANGLVRCVLEFTAGLLVFVIWRSRSAHSRLGSGLLTIVWVPVLTAAFVFPEPDYPAAAAAWCFLIYGLANNRALLSKFFSIRLIHRIGEYSYSTYLVHYFIRDWIKFAVLGRHMDWRIETGLFLACTALASVILYRLIEVPGRNHVRGLVNGSRLTLRASSLPPR
jgi:peptidoglycan/LPS O-acetylase OafA/YrhL